VNTDLRLSIAFRDHPKIVKLDKLLGKAGIVSLVTLWLYAASYWSKGILCGMDLMDVEIAARWEGENGSFVRTIHDLRLLDCAACPPRESWAPHDIVLPVEIHDWPDWQPWAYHADERSAMAREKARMRWDKERPKRDQGDLPKNEQKRAECKQHKEIMQSASETGTAGNAESRKTDAPVLASPVLASPVLASPVLASPQEKDLLPQEHNAPRRGKNPPRAFVLPDNIPQEAWKAFEEHRNRLRKPMTDRARVLIVLELRKLGGDPVLILEQSIRKGWQDVFPLHDNGTGGGGKPTAREPKGFAAIRSLRISEGRNPETGDPRGGAA
jgi:hypothetical protein